MGGGLFAANVVTFCRRLSIHSARNENQSTGYNLNVFDPQSNRLTSPLLSFTGTEISPAAWLTSGCGLPGISMELLQDPNETMRGLNGRLTGFLEQVYRLQGKNRQLEADWGVRTPSHSQDWSEQEQTVSELRAQVSLLSTIRSPFMFTLDSPFQSYLFVTAIAEEHTPNDTRRVMVMFSSRLGDRLHETLAQGQVGWRATRAGVCRLTIKKSSSHNTDTADWQSQ